MSKLIIIEAVVTDDTDDEAFLLGVMRLPGVYTVTRLDQEGT